MNILRVAQKPSTTTHTKKDACTRALTYIDRHTIRWMRHSKSKYINLDNTYFTQILSSWKWCKKLIGINIIYTFIYLYTYCFSRYTSEQISHFLNTGQHILEQARIEALQDVFSVLHCIAKLHKFISSTRKPVNSCHMNSYSSFPVFYPWIIP